MKTEHLKWYLRSAIPSKRPSRLPSLSVKRVGQVRLVELYIGHVFGVWVLTEELVEVCQGGLAPVLGGGPSEPLLNAVKF